MEKNTSYFPVSFFFLNNFGHMKQLEGLQFPDQRQNPGHSSEMPNPNH